jgi:hypothetical protein
MFLATWAVIYPGRSERIPVINAAGMTVPACTTIADRHQMLWRVRITGKDKAVLNGPMPGSRCGYSSLASTVLDVPLMKSLRGRVRHLAAFAPGVQAVVDRKARQLARASLVRSTVAR